MARTSACATRFTKSRARTRAHDDFAAWLEANPLPGLVDGTTVPIVPAATAPSGPGAQRAVAFPASGVLRQLEALARVDPGALWLPDVHSWLARDVRGRPVVQLCLPRIVPAPRGAASVEAHVAQLSGGIPGAPPAGAGRSAAWPAPEPPPLPLHAAARGGAARRSEGGDEDGCGQEGDEGGGEGSGEGGHPPALSPEDASELASLHAAVVGPAGPRLGSVLLVLLAADAAALGLWRGGELIRHKVLTGYTVRRSQGGAQAAYEACGGRGSTVGGALRRRETRRLWQRAAERLGAWATDVAECHALFQSGAVRNWGLLYSATPPPPIDRRDPRWRRLGVSVPQPRFRSLLYAYRSLSFGEWRDHRDA